MSTSTYSGDPLFSPENLRRLAELQRREDEQEEALSGFSATARTLIERPMIDLNALLGLDDKLVLPIKLNTGQLTRDLDIRAEFHLKLKADMESFVGALRVRDRTERIMRIRESIQFETPTCYLVIPPN